MPKDMKNEELFKRVLNVSLGRCPTPHTFFPKELTFGKNKQVCFLLSLNRSFVLTQEKYAKEAPNGSAYARHSSNKFGSALAKTAQSRLMFRADPLCAYSLNVENSPSAQTVRRF